MISVTGSSMSELYPRILTHVLQNGEEVAPRGQATVEVSPFAFELTDPTQCLVLLKARRLNYAFVVAERLSLLTGRADADMLCHYISGLRNFLNEEGCFDGAYGPRVRPQLDFVFEELTRDPDSRRGVVSIYSSVDQHESVDVPCTLTLQFLIRRGRLDLIVNMRSSDLFLGLPYDVSQFAFVQQVVAGWLSLAPGRYVHWTGSAHIYDRDLPKVREIVRSPDECVVCDLPVPPLPKNESMNQFHRLVEIERMLRLGEQVGTLRDALEPEYQAYVAVLTRSGVQREPRFRSPVMPMP